MKDSQEVLSDLLDHLRISANKLASEIGLKANTAIYHVKNGRNALSPELAKKITDRYPEIRFNWLVTGEGEMLKSAAETTSKSDISEEDSEKYPNATLMSVRDEIRGDLKIILDGMTENFNTMSDGIFHVLKDTQKINKFIGQLNAKEIMEAGKGLRELLKERNGS